jgi:hypothetical protein
MRRSSKISLFIFLLTGTALVAFADRGISRKAKSKAQVNINTNAGFKNNFTLNPHSGLKYKTTISNNNCAQDVNCHTEQNNLVTYQKGNTVYILPVKHKILSPDNENGLNVPKVIIKAS